MMILDSLKLRWIDIYKKISNEENKTWGCQDSLRQSLAWGM